MGEKEKNPEQIIRVEGNGTFFEIMNSAFGIGKVLINFNQYDTTTFKRIREIPIYIDITKFLQLCNDAQLHFLEQKIKKEKASIGENKKYADAVWSSMGGTTKEELARQNKTRLDKMDESRIFKVLPATLSKTADIIFQAERGPGEKTKEGLIAPKYNYKDSSSYEKVMVQLSFDDMVGIATLFLSEYQGWINNQYVKGLKTYVRRSA